MAKKKFTEDDYRMMAVEFYESVHSARAKIHEKTDNGNISVAIFLVPLAAHVATILRNCNTPEGEDNTPEDLVSGFSKLVLEQYHIQSSDEPWGGMIGHA